MIFSAILISLQSAAIYSWTRSHSKCRQPVTSFDPGSRWHLFLAPSLFRRTWNNNPGPILLALLSFTAVPKRTSSMPPEINEEYWVFWNDYHYNLRKYAPGEGVRGVCKIRESHKIA